MFVRVHAGLYIRGDGVIRIRRAQKELLVRGLYRKVWVWNVSRLQDGEFKHVHTFRTLKGARLFASEQRADTLFGEW